MYLVVLTYSSFPTSPNQAGKAWPDWVFKVRSIALDASCREFEAPDTKPGWPVDPRLVQRYRSIHCIHPSPKEA